MEGVWNVYTTEECVVCMDATTDPIFAPCGHKCCCESCADEIIEAEMPCPMCRQVIRQKRVHVLDQDVVETIPEEELSRFKREEQSAYKKQLISKRPSTRNALFRGKGRFQRSVSSYAGSELDRLAAENVGLNRVVTPSSKVVFEVISDTLAVTYKVGRKENKESYPFLSWEECVADFTSVEEEQELTAQYLAIHNPGYYWLLRYHNERLGGGVLEHRLRLCRKKLKI